MKILFCNYEYPPLGGGGGVVNAALAEELARRHEVTVLTSRAFDLPAEAIENGVRVIRVPVLFRRNRTFANFPSMLAYLPTAIWRGHQLFRRDGFDVINTHFVLPTGPVGNVLAKLSGLPNVLSVHGGDLYDPSKSLSPHRSAFLRWVVRRLANAADAIVAQSGDTLSNLRRFYLPQAKAAIIPLGIPRPPQISVSREKYGFADTDVLFITVGRLVARKTVDHLIQAISDIDDSSVKLIVVGSGPLSDALQEQARHRGVASRVRFMGRVEERTKLELLNISDVFASTSQHEGFGLVFLEAMAAGLPVICYDKGGQNDFLENGATGYLVSLNDQDGFGQRCRELAASSALRRDLGRHNQAQVEQYYIDQCAREYERLFETVVGEAVTETQCP